MKGTKARSPRGTIRTYLGIPVFEGHYTYRGMRIVPSWGGSMFEDLMVALFVPEEQLGAEELGRQPPALRPGPDRARPGRGQIRLLGFLARLQSGGGIQHLRSRCHRHRSGGLSV